jgi:hypothetical protein
LAHPTSPTVQAKVPRGMPGFDRSMVMVFPVVWILWVTDRVEGGWGTALSGLQLERARVVHYGFATRGSLLHRLNRLCAGRSWHSVWAQMPTLLAWWADATLHLLPSAANYIMLDCAGGSYSSPDVLSSCPQTTQNLAHRRGGGHGHSRRRQEVYWAARCPTSITSLHCTAKEARAASGTRTKGTAARTGAGRS